MSGSIPFFYVWLFICGQVVTLNRKILGDDHPGVADSLSDLAELRRAQGKLDEVRRLFFCDAMIIVGSIFGCCCRFYG